MTRAVVGLLLAWCTDARAEAVAVVSEQALGDLREGKWGELGLRARVLGPQLVRRRLIEATVGSPALSRARAMIADAEQASLHMQRGRAERAALGALTQLEQAAGRYAAPRLFARAQVALGLARLLRPEDAVGARGAFAAALRVDRSTRPDRGRMSSRARSLFAEARRAVSSQPSEAPRDEELAAVGRLARARWVAWIGVDPGEPAQVRTLIYDTEEDQVLLRVTRPVAGDPVEASAAALLAAARAVPGLAQQRSSRRATRQPRRRRRRRRRTRPKQWYQRWWVWTLVGGVVVAAGVSAAVIASRSEQPDRYGFEFRF